MQLWGGGYPDAGYGHRFKKRFKEEPPEFYNSYGNGSAMRVSAVGWLYDTIEDVLEYAEITAAVTHNRRSFRQIARISPPILTPPLCEQSLEQLAGY